MRGLLKILTAAMIGAPGVAGAQAPAGPPELAYAQPVIAFSHIQLVDGTGAKARADMTVIEKGGRITAVGPAGLVGLY